MATEATPTTTAGVKPGRLWIGGEYVDAIDGATFTITNPATGEALTTCAQAGPAWAHVVSGSPVAGFVIVNVAPSAAST